MGGGRGVGSDVVGLKGHAWFDQEREVLSRLDFQYQYAVVWREFLIADPSNVTALAEILENARGGRLMNTNIPRHLRRRERQISVN